MKKDLNATKIHIGTVRAFEGAAVTVETQGAGRTGTISIAATASDGADVVLRFDVSGVIGLIELLADARRELPRRA